MGKWTKFRKKLKAFTNEPKWQEKIDAWKKTFLDELEDDPSGAGANVSRLAREFANVKKKKKDLESDITELNIAIEGLSQLLVDRLEVEESQKVELNDGIVVSLGDDIYPMVVDKQKLFNWIKRTRQIALLSVHYQTLKGVAKGQLEQGKPLPPGVDAFIKTTAKIKGGGNQEEE